MLSIETAVQIYVIHWFWTTVQIYVINRNV